MSPARDIIDAIDAVTDGCWQCGDPLGSSPSGDFCSEDCQEQWAQRQVADPGGVNRSALAAEVETRYPRFMVGEKNLAAWPFDVVSRPRCCEHCGELLALVDLHSGGWGWLGFGAVCKVRPKGWKLHTKWHTPERCVEAVLQREQGALFDVA